MFRRNQQIAQEHRHCHHKTRQRIMSYRIEQMRQHQDDGKHLNQSDEI